VVQEPTLLSDHEIIHVKMQNSLKIRGPSKNTKVMLRDWQKYEPERLLFGLQISLAISKMQF
jgi:hypothetical protein